MTTALPAIGADDYCVLGLATCYLRDEGEFFPVEVIEPIPSAALEAILKGVPTSFRWALAVTVQEILREEQFCKPPAFPETAQFCDHFPERLQAAVRTYRSRPEAQAHISLGTISRNFNYSLERKRVLNVTKVVRPEDNVKQHPLTHQTL